MTADTAPTLPPLPAFPNLHSDESPWVEIQTWSTARPGPDAGKAANAIDAALRKMLADYATAHASALAQRVAELERENERLRADSKGREGVLALWIRCALLTLETIDPDDSADAEGLASLMSQGRKLAFHCEPADAARKGEQHG